MKPGGGYQKFHFDQIFSNRILPANRLALQGKGTAGIGTAGGRPHTEPSLGVSTVGEVMGSKLDPILVIATVKPTAAMSAAT